MVLAYFIVGTLFNCVDGARGLEAIPHSKGLVQMGYVVKKTGTCCFSGAKYEELPN